MNYLGTYPVACPQLQRQEISEPVHPRPGKESLVCTSIGYNSVPARFVTVVMVAQNAGLTLGGIAWKAVITIYAMCA